MMHSSSFKSHISSNSGSLIVNGSLDSAASANVAVETEPMSFPVQTARPGADGVVIENVGISTIRQHFQIIHLADFCNECGNCATFCPSSGAPFRDKPRFHVRRESYEDAGSGFHFTSGDRLEYTEDGRTAVLTRTSEGFMFENDKVRVRLDAGTRAAREVEFKAGVNETVDLRPAAEMALLFEIAQAAPPLFPGRTVEEE